MEFVRKALEPGEVVLGDRFALPCIVRIAVIDAAAERAVLASGAQVVHLERAEAGVRRGGISGSALQQDIGFQMGQEECVAVVLEPATFPACDADRAVRADFGVRLVVERQDPPAQFMPLVFRKVG